MPVLDDDDDSTPAAVGAENATPRTVKNFLMHAKGGNLPAAQAQALVEKHSDLVAKGEKWASFANYVGTQILRAEGLPEGDGE